ncbi:hypothetical protein BH11VER1_BH11VER1_23860 [soil metagenome]
MSISDHFCSTMLRGIVLWCLFALLVRCFVGSSCGADKITKIEDAWDLKLLTTVVPEFKVEKMPAPRALAKLFASIFGGKESDDWSGAINLIDDQGKKVTLEDRLITLDLVNSNTGEILNYIAELSGCHWKIWGWPGAPVLVLESMTMIDDSDLFLYSTGIPCSAKAARALGLKPEMTELQVEAALKRFDVVFDDDEQLAFWNSKSGLLAVRHHPETIAYIRTLISLSDKGWSLVKTDQTESPNKK